MEYQKIFPIIVGKTTLNFESDLINTWKRVIYSSEKSQMRQDHFYSNTTEDFLTVNQRILDSLIFTPLKEQILVNARAYANEYGIPFEDLQICNSWGYQIGQENNPDNFHSHANSFFSGVYYLTEGAPIQFKTNNFPFTSAFKFNLNESKRQEDYYHQILPEENLLIFFPSNLDHRVLQNFIDERYCIAFNIIPKGYFGVPYGNFTL
jgi:uncharacterized protein (TIGR02466 family)